MPGVNQLWQDTVSEHLQPNKEYMQQTESYVEAHLLSIHAVPCPQVSGRLYIQRQLKHPKLQPTTVVELQATPLKRETAQ